MVFIFDSLLFASELKREFYKKSNIQILVLHCTAYLWLQLVINIHWFTLNLSSNIWLYIYTIKQSKTC